jgi:hypothetical protein
MRCHCFRMHDFRVRKSIISRRIRSRIQKGLLRGLGLMKKTEGQKSRDTVPLINRTRGENYFHCNLGLDIQKSFLIFQNLSTPKSLV